MRPLSVGQEALWLLYTLAPESTAYNDAGASRFCPSPNVTALARAVRLLASRHDLLRSVFTEVDGVPGRRVLGADAVALEVRDVPDLDDAGLVQAAREVVLTPFVLEASPPLRVVLLRRATDAVLVVGNHHIATDATSQYLIWGDLLRAYHAYATGEEPDLPPPGGSYDEYVQAERAALESPQRARMEEYWLRTCAGAQAAELLTDNPRPARERFVGATLTRPLDPDLIEALTRTAAGLAVTPFAFLLGTFQALLYRYTRQEEFLLGCPTTTRRTRRTRDVVGYFVNAMVMRARFDRGSTFIDAVQAAGRQVVQGTANVGYPFPLLLRALGRSSAAGAAPLFRIAVTMVMASRFDTTLDHLAGGDAVLPGTGLRLTPVDVPRLEGQYDLNVEITRTADSMTLVFRYNTDLFAASTIERLVDTYTRMIGIAVADPSVCVSRVPLVDGAERARLLALGSASVGSL